MSKLPTAFLPFFLAGTLHASASIQLIAFTHTGNPMVTLRWNMVDYPGNTAYVLYKSSDGVVWEPAAANPVYRSYNAATILAYRDHFTDENQLYYRVKVYDANENIVEMSNTTEVENPVEERYRVHRQEPSLQETAPDSQPAVTDNSDRTSRDDAQTDSRPQSPVTAWRIAPNPVRDVLQVEYTGHTRLRDVVILTVVDASGKTLKKYRAASTATRLSLPVNTLHAGVYIARITVGTQQQLNEKFVKE